MKKIIACLSLLTGLVIFSFQTYAQKANDSILIGKQTWMVKNLNVATFRNGDPIPQVKDFKEWRKAGEEGRPAWCYFNFDTLNGKKHGKLYNWHAVNDSRGLAPGGWHIAGDEEWKELTDFLGGDDVAGTKLKSKTGWKPNDNGTNESGFTGLPGGYRYIYGYFYDDNTNGYWWTSTETGKYDAWYRGLFYNGSGISRMKYDKGHGFYVRCIKD